MEDFIEMSGGGLKKGPKKHIRGEESSLKNVDKKIYKNLKSRHTDKKEEEFLRQDLDSGSKKAKTVSEELKVGSKGYQEGLGAYSATPVPGEKRPRERVVPEEEVKPFSLRSDLDVRKQPEPDRKKAAYKPRKHRT